MKTCEQMTADVFRRMEEYTAAQKRKRKIAVRVAVPACCLCFVAAVGLWLGGGNVSKDSTANESAMINGNSFYMADAEAILEDSVDQLNIRQLPEIPQKQTQQNICLLWDDFVPMTDQELCSHFGMDIFPEVPEDLTRWPQELGLFRRDGGTGEAYWDGVALYYVSADEARSVTVNVLSGAVPPAFGLWTETQEYSVVAGVQMALAKAENGYYAEFMYGDIGFCVVTQGLSQQEFVQVLSSIVNN